MTAGKRIAVFAADCECHFHNGVFTVTVDEVVWKKTPKGGTLEAWDPDKHLVILVTKQGERHGSDGFPAFSTQRAARNLWNK